MSFRVFSDDDVATEHSFGVPDADDPQTLPPTSGDPGVAGVAGVAGETGVPKLSADADADADAAAAAVPSAAAGSAPPRWDAGEPLPGGLPSKGLPSSPCGHACAKLAPPSVGDAGAGASGAFEVGSAWRCGRGGGGEVSAGGVPAGLAAVRLIACKGCVCVGGGGWCVLSVLPCAGGGGVRT